MPIKLLKSRQSDASPAALIEEDIRLGLEIVDIYKKAKYYKDLKVKRAIANIIRNCNGALHCGGSFKNGCLYREKNLNEFWKSGNGENVVCDHAIPVTQLVELYLESKMDLKELIFSPVVRITKAADQNLTKKHAKTGTRENLPLFRYSHINLEIVTHTNKSVDPMTWTYQDHWNLINQSTPELAETLHALFGQNIPYRQKQP
jgi:hypothetical protein